MNGPIITIILLLSFFLPKTPPPPFKITIEKQAEGLMAPVCLAHANDKSGRLFVCEQTGKIKILKDGKVNEKPFLDLSDKVDAGGKVYSEKGLLGLVFHPEFKSNGRFFVYYSAPLNEKGFDHKSVLAEYRVSSNRDEADPKAQYVIMEIKQPESNHNGGQIAFGPDGHLYIGLGDGGGAGDKHGKKGNAQDLSTVLGKILRINVDGERPFTIPKDNPFVSHDDARKEIYAYGLRNPWRFSFDRANGKLYCAEVGQNKYEEVNLIEKGKNYGWRVMEGLHCYSPEVNCNMDGLEKPIAEYDHDQGISVTGGYVYRGKNIPRLTGKYIFGDWKGALFYLEESAGKYTLQKLFINGKKEHDLGDDVNSFGEDEQGEIYILAQKFTGTLKANGIVYKITAAN